MQESRAIPKFASFKAKPSPAPEDVKTSTRVDDESRDEEKSRHRSRHRSHHHHSSSRHKQERPKSHEEQEPSRSADVVKEDLQDLYKIDRKGDIHNIVYGTIHRYSIPQYRRTGRGSVLGLSPQCKIDRAYEGEDYIVIRKDDWVADGSRHKTKSVLWRSDIQSQHVFRIRQTSKQAYDGASQSYIPLVNEVSRKRRKVSNGHETDISDDEADKYGYRSILGKAKTEDDVPSDMEKHEESNTDEENIALRWNREANQHNSKLLKHAEANPGDVNAWLELIKYQVILLTGSDSHRQLTSAEQRSLADIKLTLYEKALKRIGKGTAKDRVLLGYLEEGSKIWESTRLAEQWHAILKNNPGYISLWMRYIDFRQTSSIDFTFERCTDVYLECMKLNASSDSEEKELIQAHLFLRMTLLMREAGYTELAVGLWQAVLEFTLFRPVDCLNSSKSEILESFRLFWESEVARLGEPGSKGWSSGRSSELEPVETNAVTSIEPETLFLHWSEEERRLSRSSRLPARTVDIVENDDPFRVVLWSDISPYLSFFTSWQERDILVDEFLKFCYLPILYQQTSSSGGNAFLHNEILYFRDSCLDKMINPSPDQLQRRHVFDSTPLHNLVHSVDTLFANDDWIQSMSTWKEIVQNPEATIDGEWIRRCLRQLVGVSPHDDNLAELALAVEHTLNANEGKKYAKSILKKRPSGLRLYNAFALMESRSGNFASASHVWATTFSMAANLSEEQRLQYATIIRSWTWEYLAAGRMESAVQVLVSSADYAISLESLQEDGISAVTPVQRLKAERFLLESADHSLAINDLQAFTAWTDLVALSHYLLGSLDLASSLDVYKTSFNRLAKTLLSDHDKSYALELLHQSRARILYHHITSRRAYKPGVVRALLVESTRTFPHNTFLLSLFTWNESRFRIDERLRSSVPSSSFSASSDTDLMNPPVVTSSLIDIFAELNRPIYTGSTVYSARAAFERALQVSVDSLHSSSSSSPSSPSPSLWKLYIAFELYRAKDGNAANKAFYRALRACPWSKDIVMLAFNFRSSLDAGAGSGSGSGSGSRVKEPVAEGVELLDGRGGGNALVDDWWESCKIYNVLLDKGLRVHVEIDDEMLKQGENKWIETETETEHKQRRRGVDGKDAWMARRRKEVIYLPDDADASDQLS